MGWLVEGGHGGSSRGAGEMKGDIPAHLRSLARSLARRGDSLNMRLMPVIPLGVCV